MAERGSAGRTDRLLLVEVALIGVFLILLFALYLIPVVTAATYQPGAWRWITLAIPFFGALYLETRRRRVAQRAAVRAVLEGEAAPESPPLVDGDDLEPLAGEPPTR